MVLSAHRMTESKALVYDLYMMIVGRHDATIMMSAFQYCRANKIELGNIKLSGSHEAL